MDIQKCAETCVIFNGIINIGHCLKKTGCHVSENTEDVIKNISKNAQLKT